MDRNTVIGILMIGAILITYSIVTRPDKEEMAALKRKQDSIMQIQQEIQQAKIDSLKNVKKSIEGKNDSVGDMDTFKISGDQAKKELIKEFGAFANAAEGDDDYFVLENNFIKATISSKGGRIYSVLLKEYQRYDSAPLILFDGDKNNFSFNFFAQNKSISTNKLYFKTINNTKSLYADAESKKMVLRSKIADDKYIEYIYTLNPNTYLMDYDVKFINLDDVIADNINTIGMNWKMTAPSLERGKKNENMYTSIYYKFYNDEVDHLSGRSNKDQEEELNTRVRWIAFKHQFFSSVLIADSAFLNGLVTSHQFEDTAKYLKRFTAKTTLPYNNKAEENIGFKYYFGPNHFTTLKKIGMELEELVDLGGWIFKWINRYVIIPIFNWLDNFIGSYGIIILLLTIIIKIVLFPLTYRSYQSQAKMKVLKPQIDELNKKFPKEKAMEKQRAQMALYKKAGVSPMGGCLPLLLQMPILIAMYRFFPTSIELRGESFLWAQDLSTYDSIANLPFSIPFYGDHVSLFTLLMTATTILTMRFSNQTSASSSQMPGMKSMMYVMPFMLLFILNGFSAALTYYLFLSNLITVGQNAISKKFINEKEIIEKINNNKKKPVKKSKFQAKLEEMQKQRGAHQPKKKKK